MERYYRFADIIFCITGNDNDMYLEDGVLAPFRVDGPEFDGHEIDFDEAISRSNAYAEFEKRERETSCNLLNKEVQ